MASGELKALHCSNTKSSWPGHGTHATAASRPAASDALCRRRISTTGEGSDTNRRECSVFGSSNHQSTIDAGERPAHPHIARVDVAVRAAALRAHHRNKGAYRRNPHGIVTKMEAIRRQVEVMAKCP